MQSFEFKPALLARRDHWRIDNGFLMKNGELACELAAVDRARFAEMSSTRIHAAWFDLYKGGERCRIACNLRPPDENQRTYLALVAAVLDDLASRKPGLKVAFGSGGSGVGWTMFIMGMVILLAAVACIIGEVMMDAPAGELVGVVIGCLFFGAIGAGLAWAYRPWAPPPELDVGAARDAIASLAVNDQPAGAEQDGKDPEQHER